MLICEGATIESWSPDFSASEQPDPTWLRVSVPEGEISNALSWIDCTENPAQVVLCESCGVENCASGGYVHVSRLQHHVLWTAPQLRSPEDMAPDAGAIHMLVERQGGLAIPRAEWARWRREVPGLPTLEDLPAMNGRALADAWRMSAPRLGRAGRLADVVPMLESRLLSSDSLGLERAIRSVEEIVASLELLQDTEVRGALLHPQSIGATIETLYLDGPEVVAWPALALADGGPLLALGEHLVFVPHRA